MNKALAALLLFLASVSAALAQQSVNVPATMASIAITGATGAPNQVLVTGLPGKSIFVTAVDLVPSGASVVTFSQGSGALCGTGNAPLTGALTFTASQTYLKGDGYGAFWVLLPGNSLCINIGTAAAPGSLAYAQF